MITRLCSVQPSGARRHHSCRRHRRRRDRPRRSRPARSRFPTSTRPIRSRPARQITYTITIVNNGGAKISNVVMSDQLNGVGGIGVPPQFQIASSRGRCTAERQPRDLNGGTIEGSGSWVVSIRGIVTASNGTVLNNTGLGDRHEVGPELHDNDYHHDTREQRRRSNLPDLIDQQDGPDDVVVSLADDLHPDREQHRHPECDRRRRSSTRFQRASQQLPRPERACSCAAWWPDGHLRRGAVTRVRMRTMTINAHVASRSGQITNTAVVDPDNTIAESNELNNTSALVNTQVTGAIDAPALGINSRRTIPLVISGRR